MSARSKRLFGPSSIAVDVQTVMGPVPAGKVWLVKSIRAVNHGTTAPELAVSIGAMAFGSLVLRRVLASKETYVDPDTDPIVLSAGQTMVVTLFSGAGAGPVTVTMSGAELTA